MAVPPVCGRAPGEEKKARRWGTGGLSAFDSTGNRFRHRLDDCCLVRAADGYGGIGRAPAYRCRLQSALHSEHVPVFLVAGAATNLKLYLALRSSILRPSAAVSFVRVAIEIGTPNSTRATVGRETPASLASPAWLRPRLVRACRICSPMLMSHTPDTSACRLSSAFSRSFTTSRIVHSMKFQSGSPSAVTGRKITASIMS